MVKQPVNTLEEKPDKPPLRQDQIEDLGFYIKNHRCANLSDPGTGKTPSVCQFFQYLWMYENTKTVWVMPKSLLEKNRDEILRFTDLKPEHVQIIDGNPRQREKQINDPNNIVMLLGFRRWCDSWRDILQAQPKVDCVAGDEVHMGWKSHNSKTTKQLFQSMKRIRRFLPMTGTLVAGRLDSAYPVVHIIEPRYYPNYWVFFATHAITDFDNNVVGWREHEKLGRILARHAVRRRFNDIFGKQDVVENKVMCEMTEKQRESYDQMENEALVELDDEIIDGSLPGVATTRCRQIMSHPETLGIDTTPGKDEQLRIDLEDARRTETSLIIYSALQPEQKRIKQICEEEGFRVGLINGDVSSGERSRIDQQFRNGKIDILVASPATAAFGYNWSHVDHMIFVSRDYQDDSFEQAKRRAIRGQRQRPLRVSIYEYRNSIDQRIDNIIRTKQRDSVKVDRAQFA